MTLQLEVGKTYRARNGDVVRIVDFSGFQNQPCRGDDGCLYSLEGRWEVDDRMSEWDLIEEIRPTSPLDAAIAKYEAAWVAAQQALDAAKGAADAVVQAAKKGKL